MAGLANKCRFTITGVLVLLFISATAYGFLQDITRNAQQPDKKTPTKIYIENSDSGMHSQEMIPDVQIFYGNVTFRHDSTFLYCDSAYLNQAKNNLEAFSNVRMEQGDTLFIHGDYMMYEGNTKLARIRENVRMINQTPSQTVTLLTDSFNFDQVLNIGYFFDGGMIIDEQNELTSIYGQYSPATKEAFFNKNVKLKNPKFTLTSDTLKYNTITKIATILGPTVIESDSGTIYSDLGWYNTITGESRLFKRSKVVSKDKTQIMIADSLYYNRTTGFCEAFGNMFLNDTVKKVILTGNYGYFDDVNKKAMATDSAQFIEYSQGDSLYLHGDTLRMITAGDNNREIKAYYGVRFYRTDIQGVCDSLQFNTRDTILYMYTNPILWNTGYQLTGDTIQLLFSDSTIKKANVINYAFASEKLDTSYFNQLKGRNLIAFFDNGELRKIDVSGNAETIFFPAEKDGSFIGMNKTESSFFSTTIKERKLERTVLWPEPKASTTPLPDLTPDSKFLKGFVDFNYLRPKRKEDIFLKTERKIEDAVEQPKRKRSRK